MKNPVDALLEEYLLLEAELKVKNKCLDDLKKWCKDQGSFSTEQFVCSVVPRERRGLAPLEEVASVIGRDILEGFGLIRTTSYSVVSVSQKAEYDKAL